MTGVSEPDPAAALAWETAEPLDQDWLSKVAPDLSPEVADEIRRLGFFQGFAAATGAAATRGQAAYEEPTQTTGAAEFPAELGVPGTWQAIEGVKFIDGVPVASGRDMSRFAIARLKHGESTNVGPRLVGILVRHVRDHPTNTGLTETAKIVRESTHLFDQYHNRCVSDITIKRVEYIGLLGMLTMTKAMLALPWDRPKLETGVANLSTGSVRFMVAFLNHTLQLDPPLEVPYLV